MYPACNHRFPGPLAPSGNWKSLHSFHNRERLRTPNHVRLQQAARESKRLYDFVVIASQPLCMGSTFGTLQASQPSSCGPEETRESLSVGHVPQKLQDSREAEPLREGVASKMDKSAALPKESQVTHPTWKARITWRGTGSRRTGVPTGDGEDTVLPND